MGKKNQLIRVILLILFVISVHSTDTNAKEPTIEESILFINKKIERYVKDHNKSKDRLVYKGNCICEYIYYNDGDYKAIFNLSDFDPNRVLVSDLNTVYLYTTDNVTTIKIIDDTGDGPPIKFEKYDLGIVIHDDEQAQRIAKAFRHLIKMCGGKGELF